MSEVLSYSAGSSSEDPLKFRVIDETGSSRKMSRLLEVFPELARSLAEPDQILLINAYPATLGGLRRFRSVDTYLHPTTFVRATGLAGLEKKTVLVAAQPLMGAEMILAAVKRCVEFPPKMIWATGGYPLPRSLEEAVAQWLRDRHCDLQIVHCYGVAELDHTLFAATQRHPGGQLIYRCVHPDLVINDDAGSRVVSMTLGDRVHRCDDNIRRVGESFRVLGDHSRYQTDTLEYLETWSVQDWSNRTGFVTRVGPDRFVQRRMDTQLMRPGEPPTGSIARKEVVQFQDKRSARSARDRELSFYRYAERFGMSWQQKPLWRETIKPPIASERRLPDAA